MVSSATWNGYESSSIVNNNNGNNSSSSDTKVVVRAKGHPDPVQGDATATDTTKEDSCSSSAAASVSMKISEIRCENSRNGRAVRFGSMTTDYCSFDTAGPSVPA